MKEPTKRNLINHDSLLGVGSFLIGQHYSTDCTLFYTWLKYMTNANARSLNEISCIFYAFETKGHLQIFPSHSKIYA